MVDILHRIGVESSSPDKVYEALTTIDGLTGWWTTDTSGDPDVGGVIEFRFVPGGIDMEVAELSPPNRVVWKPVNQPEEWIGTTISFDIEQDGAFTIVLFRHEGWSEPGAFMHHCSTKWAIYLMSLKSLLETGTGAPAPHDVQISDWH